MNDTISLINTHSRNLQRIAARLGLNFHINDGFLVPLSFKYGVRDATPEEVAMWAKLCIWNPDEPLPATPEEVKTTWQYGFPGPYIVNPQDYATVRNLGPNYFEVCTNADLLEQDILGWYGKQKIPVYTSPNVPIGFYYANKYPSVVNQVLGVAKPEVVLPPSQREILEAIRPFTMQEH